MPDSPYKDDKIEELGAELTPVKSGRLSVIVEELAGLQAMRESEKKFWSQKGKDYKEAERMKAEAQRIENVKRLENLVDSTLADITGDESLKPFLDDEVPKAARVFALQGAVGQDGPKKYLRTLTAGLVHDKLLAALQKAGLDRKEAEAVWQKEKTELTARIAALEKAEPKAGDSPTAQAGSEKLPSDLPEGRAELNRWWTGQTRKLQAE